jgi:hypothetical protein
MTSQVDEIMGTFMCSRSEATALLKMRAKIARETNDERRHRLEREFWAKQQRLMLRSVLVAPCRVYVLNSEV